MWRKPGTRTKEAAALVLGRGIDRAVKKKLAPGAPSQTQGHVQDEREDVLAGVTGTRHHPGSPERRYPRMSYLVCSIAAVVISIGALNGEGLSCVGVHVTDLNSNPLSGIGIQVGPRGRGSNDVTNGVTDPGGNVCIVPVQRIAVSQAIAIQIIQDPHARKQWDILSPFDRIVYIRPKGEYADVILVPRHALDALKGNDTQDQFTRIVLKAICRIRKLPTEKQRERARKELTDRFDITADALERYVSNILNSTCPQPYR
jgi:hypothetical protein